MGFNSGFKGLNVYLTCSVAAPHSGHYYLPTVNADVCHKAPNDLY